jgi:hypothetical protein
VSEQNHSDQDKENSDSGQDNGSLGYLRGVCIAASWAFIGLLLTAIFWPNLTERAKFFTGNLFNLIIAFAVIAQVVIYRKQWAVMKQQISSAEKNSIYANRAYVVAKIRDVGDYDDMLQFRLRIENSGNTPANNVMVLYAFDLREKPPHDERPGEPVVYDMGFTKTERLGLIAPNGSYHVIATPPVALYPMGGQEFDSGDLKFYCWGRIVYEDIFNEKRHTDFCFVQSQSQPNGYPCKHGNEAY